MNISSLLRGIWFIGIEHENTLIVTLDGTNVYETKVGGEEDVKGIDQNQSPTTDATNARIKNIKFKATAGPHKVGVTFLERTMAESEGRLIQFGPDRSFDRWARIGSFEIRGPFNPTGLSTTPSRQRIFMCYPKPHAAKAEEEVCARKILSGIAHRAYWRPVSHPEILS